MSVSKSSNLKVLQQPLTQQLYLLVVLGKAAAVGYIVAHIYRSLCQSNHETSKRSQKNDVFFIYVVKGSLGCISKRSKPTHLNNHKEKTKRKEQKEYRQAYIQYVQGFYSIKPENKEKNNLRGQFKNKADQDKGSEFICHSISLFALLKAQSVCSSLFSYDLLHF